MLFTVVFNCKIDNHGTITKAIEGLNKILMNQEEVLNKLADVMANKYNEMRNTGGQPS